MSFRFRWFAAVLVVALAGCGGSSPDSAAPTTSVAPTTTTLVPESPSIEYLNDVMAKLQHVRGDIRREVYATQSLSPVALSKIEDLYDPESQSDVREIWSASSLEDHSDSPATPGDERQIIRKILDSQPGCVVVETMNDNSALYLQPDGVLKGPFAIELRSFPGDNRSNPTPWKITFEGRYDATQPGYTCES